MSIQVVESSHCCAGAKGTGHENHLYRASESGVNLFLCGHGKLQVEGRRDLSAEHSIRIMPRSVKLVTAPGPWPGVEAVTSHRPNSNLGSGGRGRRARATPAAGPARAATSGSHRRRRRAVYPPCRAAPTSAGCKPPRARRRRAGRGGRRFRAASRRRATSRAPSCPPARRPGRLAAPHRP